jgi:hypothetical protein
MNLQDDLNTLRTHDSFIRYLRVINELREETISELHEASTDKIQQLSGRILSYDQILHLSNFTEVKDIALQTDQ